MLRITTGTAKNKRLKIPEIEGFRGVQEIAKMSLFAILADKVKNAVCLDLFAGSGNLGLEALSRGASWCDFVDESSASALVIEENIHNCGFLEMSQVYRKSAVKYVAGCEKKYDLIFMDPFYDNTSHKHLFKNIKNILNSSGKVFYFHKDSIDVATILSGTDLHIVDTRKFGESVFDEIVIG
jgi:16S rRNA (guanine966-N2)-methyltransferase